MEKNIKKNDKEYILFSIGMTIFIMIVFFEKLKNLPLYVALLDCSKFFLEVFIVMLLVFFYRLIRKRPIKTKVFYVVAIIYFLASLPYIPYLCGYKTTQIGDFYESREYKEKYYVVMSRKPKTVEGRKQYFLSAEIERCYDQIGTTREYENAYGQQYGGHDIYELNYHINYIFFSNNGYLCFENQIININDETRVTDSKGNTYYVTLTRKKVS